MRKLTKQAAAQLLGCAERQIQRYAQVGKLTVEYVQEGRTRRALYSEIEVQALKQQQATPELRGIAVQPTTDHRQLTTNLASDSRSPTPLALPPQALQVLQMLGATAGVEDGKCVSVEEMKFEQAVRRCGWLDADVWCKCLAVFCAGIGIVSAKLSSR